MPPQFARNPLGHVYRRNRIVPLVQPAPQKVRRTRQLDNLNRQQRHFRLMKKVRPLKQVRRKLVRNPLPPQPYHLRVKARSRLAVRNGLSPKLPPPPPPPNPYPLPLVTRPPPPPPLRLFRRRPLVPPQETKTPSPKVRRSPPTPSDFYELPTADVARATVRRRRAAVAPTAYASTARAAVCFATRAAKTVASEPENGTAFSPTVEHTGTAATSPKVSVLPATPVDR